MQEKAELLQARFSVADAEYPSFSLRDGTLTLEFVDWREYKVKVTFLNAVGVRWQELFSDGPEDRDDQVYEIIDSTWLEQYISSKARTEEENLRHFKLCFNAYGVFEVLASEMQEESNC